MAIILFRIYWLVATLFCSLLESILWSCILYTLYAFIKVNLSELKLNRRDWYLSLCFQQLFKQIKRAPIEFETGRERAGEREKNLLCILFFPFLFAQNPIALVYIYCKINARASNQNSKMRARIVNRTSPATHTCTHAHIAALPS